MAEYCKKCSLEILGLEEHDEPCFCEGCSKQVENNKLLLKLFFILKSIKIKNQRGK